MTKVLTHQSLNALLKVVESEQMVDVRAPSAPSRLRSYCFSGWDRASAQPFASFIGNNIDEEARRHASIDMLLEFEVLPESINPLLNKMHPPQARPRMRNPFFTSGSSRRLIFWSKGSDTLMAHIDRRDPDTILPKKHVDPKKPCLIDPACLGILVRRAFIYPDQSRYMLPTKPFSDVSVFEPSSLLFKRNFPYENHPA